MTGGEELENLGGLEENEEDEREDEEEGDGVETSVRGTSV